MKCNFFCISLFCKIYMFSYFTYINSKLLSFKFKEKITFINFQRGDVLHFLNNFLGLEGG